MPRSAASSRWSLLACKPVVQLTTTIEVDNWPGDVEGLTGQSSSASRRRAGIGVQVGIKLQNVILEKRGRAGSTSTISLSFVAVLVIVGGYVFYSPTVSGEYSRDEWVV